VALSPRVYIPGNYGKADLVMQIYDIVDTLDVLMPDQMFYEQPFTLKYHCPEAIAPYFQEKITMPPFVERHPDFDNEFSRVLVYLIDEGKSPEQIAEMAMADVSFVNEILGTMVDRGYMRNTEQGYFLTFPAITVAEAEAARPLAESTSEALVKMIEKNLPAYWQALDSLVQAGAVSSDSNFFMDGGTIIYRPYAVVSTMFLWFDLGKRFITRRNPLVIYRDTDLCNAHIPDYLYAVQGGDVFNGTNYYYQYHGQRGYKIFYGDRVPDLLCEEGYLDKGRKGFKAEWYYTEESRPEDFVIDTTVIRPVLSALGQGSDSLVTETYFNLQKLAKQFSENFETNGLRYWFWNLVASKTLHKLDEAGIVKRRGNGLFRFVGAE
ncbi:MAG: hypothetical protein OEW00_14905, partial [candidate division Zixibacteria bacterium]|nr:hypothetical protein [candidate division Zixibacteria bacterium]